MKKFYTFNLVAKGPQKFTKITFCNMISENFRQKIPTQYLRLDPFALKNFKILSFLAREKVKYKLHDHKFYCIQNLIEHEKFPFGVVQKLRRQDGVGR